MNLVNDSNPQVLRHQAGQSRPLIQVKGMMSNDHNVVVVMVMVMVRITRIILKFKIHCIVVGLSPMLTMIFLQMNIHQWQIYH